MAEWLRRWTRNPMGFSLTGSNPVHDEIFLSLFFKTIYISTVYIIIYYRIQSFFERFCIIHVLNIHFF